jgi:hypothetical protein
VRPDRRELLKLLKALAPGDVVTVTRIDRLARSGPSEGVGRRVRIRLAPAVSLVRTDAAVFASTHDARLAIRRVQKITGLTCWPVSRRYETTQRGLMPLIEGAARLL